MKALILSPTQENLDLCGCLVSTWSEADRIAIRVFATGARRARYTFTKEVSIEHYEEVFVFLGDVDRLDEVVSKLHGARRVTWFCWQDSALLRDALRDVPNLTVYCGHTLTDAFLIYWGLKGHARQPTLLRLGQTFGREFRDHPLTELSAYLDYKKALSFLQMMDAGPLREAILFLAEHDPATFSLTLLPPPEQHSVSLFKQFDYPFLEGFSAPVQRVKLHLMRVAPTDLNVLLIGETGTGKEAAAFYLHEFSKRRGRPYLVLNCAGLDRNLLRSELFGHAKGAFTDAKGSKHGLVEEAEGGTLFLDEVAHMPPDIQKALLRFLQTKTFERLGDTKTRKADVRIIAAARPEIHDLMARNEFRDDLYYRLAEFDLRLPSLSEIPDDLPYFIRHVAHRQAARMSKSSDEVEAAITYFTNHMPLLLERLPTMRGNVRELQRLIQRRLLLEEDVLDLHFAPGTSTGATSGTLRAAAPGTSWGSPTHNDGTLDGSNPSAQPADQSVGSIPACHPATVSEAVSANNPVRPPQQGTIPPQPVPVAGIDPGSHLPPWSDLPTLDDVKRRYLRQVADTYRGEHSQADIARRLGITVNTLKGYLRSEEGDAPSTTDDPTTPATSS